MATKRKRETKKYPLSEGNLAVADESLGVLHKPKAKPLSPVLGVAQDISEEHLEVEAFAPSKGMIAGLGLSWILGCLITLMRYWIS